MHWCTLQINNNNGDFSVGAIIGIAAGGVTALMIILLGFICCCFHCWKQHEQKVYVVPQTTIQIMYV